MKGIYAVYRKEMGHYFVSPVAYIIVAVFLILTAYFFNRLMVLIIQESFQASIEEAQFGGGQAFDVPSLVMRNFFGVLSTLLLFLTPMLTMSVYAEERRRGTMELLMTSPVTDLEIVLGKFFASLTLLVIMLLPTAIGFAYMLRHAEPTAPWRVLGSEYLGVLLLGAALLALGSFFSSVTESQLIAAMLSFGAILLLWVLDFGSQAGSSVWASSLEYLSVFRHYDDFTRGVIDTSNVIFYLSFIFLGVFLTIRSVDSMRWRRA
ncbi:MAG: ABC transporter permease [Acidobacteria bacterium]|nr:MAG: ABC transporter permease [Acidobacteriota bacterium]